MDTPNSSINIATILIVGMIVLGFLSLVTLAIYFLGGESPLERNALGRIEAARNAADVLLEQRRWGRGRTIVGAFLFFGLLTFLYFASPDNMRDAAIAFVDACLVALSKVQNAMGVLLQQIRAG